MQLLEREPQMAEMHRALAEAGAGRGRTLLVTGEAGIGKTALVEHFVREVEPKARVLWGACEALFAPRPLGPFYDVVHSLGGPLLARLESDARPIDLFHGLLDAIRRHEEPSVVVLEDLHWADDATLDFIRFIGRRIDRTPGLLVMTFRDDEVHPDHPLTAVLGELPISNRVRIQLPALSQATVNRLARESGRDEIQFYRVTGGNPFYVTELLQSSADTVVPNVREAVLSRARRLSTPAREVLDLVSVVPDRLELALLRNMHPSDLVDLEECIERGMLGLDAGHVFFRHEIARLAIESAISPVKRARLNSQVMQAIAARGEAGVASLARIAHYAIAAGEPAAIIRYGPRAAAAASSRGAHNEAAALLAAVLPHANAMPVPDRALFFEQRARACGLVVAQGPEAAVMSEAAYALWESLGDEVAKARNVAQRCEFIVWNRPGRPAAVAPLARQAIALIEPLLTDAITVGAPPDGTLRVDLALAYAELAMALGADDASTALRAHAVALEHLAQTLPPADRTKILARLTMAEFQLFGAPLPTHVEQFHADARTSRDDYGIVSAYCREGWMLLRDLALDALEPCLAAGRALSVERQLDRTPSAQILSRLTADLAARRGELDRARKAFHEFGERPGHPWQVRLCYVTAKTLMLAARCGEEVDAGLLEEGLARQAELYKFDVYDLHRARAEIHWILGNPDMARVSAQTMIGIALQWRHPWVLAEAMLWARVVRAQKTDIVGTLDVDAHAAPYLLQQGDRWREAAHAWLERGLPYEAALAHAQCREETDQREALRLLENMGAEGAARRVREQMRERGLRAIPTGPRPATRANAAGLTPRELEILILLARGLSNAKIAARLHRSVRTIEHHVAALSEKLGAENRQAAVARARERGLLQD